MKREVKLGQKIPPIGWVYGWVIEIWVTARKVEASLVTDFTEEKMVAGAGFEPATLGL